MPLLLQYFASFKKGWLSKTIKVPRGSRILTWACVSLVSIFFAGSTCAEETGTRDGFTIAIYDQNVAFKRMKVITELLSKDEGEKFNQRFLAFRLQGFSLGGEYCSYPFLLGGTERVNGRKSGLLFVCGAGIFYLTDALVTFTLLAIAEGGRYDPTRTARLISEEVNYVVDIDWKGQLKSGYVPCDAARRAYIYAKSLEISTCNLIYYDEVMSYFWPKIKKGYVTTPWRKSPVLVSMGNFPTFIDQLTKNISEAIFDYLVLHEAAHLLYGDTWNDASLDFELRADALATRVLGEQQDIGDVEIFLRAIVQPFSVMYAAAMKNKVQDGLGQRPVETGDFEARFEIGRQAAKCMPSWRSTDAAKWIDRLRTPKVEFDCSKKIDMVSTPK